MTRYEYFVLFIHGMLLRRKERELQATSGMEILPL
jgi:hypothetical protein